MSYHSSQATSSKSKALELPNEYFIGLSLPSLIGIGMWIMRMSYPHLFPDTQAVNYFWIGLFVFGGLSGVVAILFRPKERGVLASLLLVFDGFWFLFSVVQALVFIAILQN